jgi:kinase
MNLIGEILEAFASLTELTVLAMSSNNLTGSIPAWVWQLQKLELVYLYANALSGELTCDVTAVNLVELDVSQNQLTGEIPGAFGKLRNLDLMFLYRNRFTGTIPASIGLLPQLRDIRIFDKLVQR